MFFFFFLFDDILLYYHYCVIYINDIYSSSIMNIIISTMCLYPADQILIHISFKSIQVTGYASTRCHMPYGSGHRLPVEIGSDVVMCRMISDLASWLRWAPALSRALQFRISSSAWGELRRCHVSYDSEPRLPAEVGSDAATCPMSLDHASSVRWTPAQSRVLCLWTSPPGWGGLRRCHVYRCSLWVVGLKHKEKSSRYACAGRHACSQCTCARF
jgi:hypothetical protein